MPALVPVPVVDLSSAQLPDIPDDLSIHTEDIDTSVLDISLPRVVSASSSSSTMAKHLGANVATTTSTANVALVESLGADVVVDYKMQDFEEVLRDYDVVLNSQDGKTLEKSLRVLKRGGKLISISGPPDPEFGEEIAASGFVKLVMRLLSSSVRRKAKGRGIGYSFLFMKANGGQLRQITQLIEAGAIRPVMDRVFPFESINEAMAYVESGRAKGKVVIKIK